MMHIQQILAICQCHDVYSRSAAQTHASNRCCKLRMRRCKQYARITSKADSSLALDDHASLFYNQCTDMPKHNKSAAAEYVSSLHQHESSPKI